MAVDWDKADKVLQNEGVQPRVRELIKELVDEIDALEDRVTTLET